MRKLRGRGRGRGQGRGLNWSLGLIKKRRRRRRAAAAEGLRPYGALVRRENWRNWEEGWGGATEKRKRRRRSCGESDLSWITLLWAWEEGKELF